MTEARSRRHVTRKRWLLLVFSLAPLPCFAHLTTRRNHRLSRKRSKRVSCLLRNNRSDDGRCCCQHLGRLFGVVARCHFIAPSQIVNDAADWSARSQERSRCPFIATLSRHVSLRDKHASLCLCQAILSRETDQRRINRHHPGLSINAR